GKIAVAVASKAKAFGLRVLAHDPYLDAGLIARHGVQPVDLDTLLADSDAVSIHVPLSPETRNLIGEQELARMKPTGFVINTSRGVFVNEQALADAPKAVRMGAV